MTKTWKLTAAAALAPCLASAAAAGPYSPADDAAAFTTLVVQPIVSPRAVNASDGRAHIVYELSLVNETTLHTRIDSIAAFDPATGAPLGDGRARRSPRSFA